MTSDDVYKMMDAEDGDIDIPQMIDEAAEGLAEYVAPDKREEFIIAAKAHMALIHELGAVHAYQDASKWAIQAAGEIISQTLPLLEE